MISKKQLYKVYHYLGFHLINSFEEKKIFRVSSVKRSGHHAIINWIMRQWNGSVSYHNYVRLGSPIYKSAFNHETKLRLPVKNPLIMYNHEEIKLSELKTDQDFYSNYWKQRKIVDIVVIRDPFNCFASRMKANWKWDNRFNESESNRQKTIDIWKDHAKECLNITNNFPDKVVVNYNQWILDRSYRMELARILGVNFTDAGFTEVTDYGNGSSFDGLNRIPSNQALLNRWAQFENDPIFNKIFEDKELISLSDQLFGFVPKKFAN